jgi:hypothetical protein
MSKFSLYQQNATYVWVSKYSISPNECVIYIQTSTSDSDRIALRMMLPVLIG